LIAAAPGNNYIIVDWGQLSGGTSGFTAISLTSTAALALYPLVILNVPIVGFRVADFLNFLGVNAGISAANVWIIGHSVGAHIAGYAGQVMQSTYSGNLSHITGLDPAGPLILYGLSLTQDVPSQQRLAPSNAVWVDAIHTGRGLTGFLGLPLQGTGFGTLGTNVGNTDIFVNSGAKQPGCNQTDVIVQAYCDHSYSWKWYTHTITAAKGGCPCSTSILFGSCFSSGVTCGTPTPVGYSMPPGTTGKYYTQDTNSYST